MIGKNSKETLAERTERSDAVFPEPYGVRGDMVPDTWSWKTSDASCEPSYIGSSEDMPGHESDVAGARMGDPFSDAWDYGMEPKGSAPASGEGINAASKPQGAGLEPENSDYYE